MKMDDITPRPDPTVLTTQNLEKESAALKELLMTHINALRDSIEKQNEASAAAVTKSEISTTKSIEQQGIMLQSATKTLAGQISDLKERLTRIEGHKDGRSDYSIPLLMTLTAAIVGLVVFFIQRGVDSASSVPAPSIIVVPTSNGDAPRKVPDPGPTVTAPVQVVP